MTEPTSPSATRPMGSSSKEQPDPFRSQLGPLLFLTAIFFLNFMARIIFAPLMPAISKDLGVGHGGAGALFLFISVGYFATLTASGLFTARLTHRRTIVLSAVTLGIALLGTAMCESVWGIRLGLLLLGMAAGIYLPSGIATLTDLIDSRHWGKAVAIHELAPNLSFVAAPVVSEALMVWVSWREVLMLLGVCSLALGTAYARFGRGGRFPAQAFGFAPIKRLLSERLFWIMIVLFSLAITATLGVYTMLPLYLVTDKGIDRNWANTIIAASRISGIGMAFLAGWITDRVGAGRTMTMVFLLTGIATLLLGAASNSWVILVVFLQPVVAVCFFPPGFAALSSIGPSHSRNVAVSLTVPVAFIFGGGLIPMAIGMMGDAGYFSLGISVVGGIILGGSALSLGVKVTNVGK